jgi:hypothetical protein
MTLRARAVALFPLAWLCLNVAIVVGAATIRASLLVLLPLSIYLVPVAAFRIHQALWPIKEGRSRLDSPEYSPWWGAHQFQVMYAAFPALEAALRLVPGCYSAWLRLWGSRIGRRVHWTPRVEIADRSLLEVGDDVVFGHLTACYAHLIKRRDSQLILYVRRIRVGDRVLLGAGSRLGPGARIASGATLDVLTDVGVGRRIGDEA